MPTVEENERNFEGMGLARVRMLVSTSGLPQQMMSDAIQWVARREEEERQRGLLSEIEGKRIARSTLIAAWIAAAASIFAVAVACLAWLFPRP
jgi:hypothetical protein